MIADSCVRSPTRAFVRSFVRPFARLLVCSFIGTVSGIFGSHLVTPPTHLVNGNFSSHLVCGSVSVAPPTHLVVITVVAVVGHFLDSSFAGDFRWESLEPSRGHGTERSYGAAALDPHPHQKGY